MSGGTGPVGNHRRAARLSGLQLLDRLVHAGVALAEPLHSRAVTAWPASPSRLMATPLWRASSGRRHALLGMETRGYPGAMWALGEA